MSRVAFVHVTEPGFESGGAELRAKRLYGALHPQLDGTSLNLVSGVRRLPWAPARLGASLRGTPPRLTRLFDSVVKSSVNQVVMDSDLSVASTVFTASLIDRALLPRVVLDSHNLEWRVNSQLAVTSGGIIRKSAYRVTTPWMGRFEARLAKSVAGVWAVSVEEANWFEALDIPVWVVPNGVDLPALTTTAPPSAEVLFVGSLNSLFNRRGLEWFCSTVWPEVRRRVPDARLAIAGSGPRLTLPDGVVQLGFVEDLEALYERAQLCIAPLLAGAGTRLKVLEAMARARPVVSTTIGAEGLDVTSDHGVFLEDDPDAFAKTCASLLSDRTLAVEQGNRARARAAAYSWDSIASVAAQSLRDLSRS